MSAPLHHCLKCGDTLVQNRGEPPADHDLFLCFTCETEWWDSSNAEFMEPVGWTVFVHPLAAPRHSERWGREYGYVRPRKLIVEVPYDE